MNELNEEIRRQIEDYEAEIRCLTTDLAWSGEFGDYKIMKTYEARLQGKDDPYDTDALIAKRDEARARINELQELIKALEQ